MREKGHSESHGQSKEEPLKIEGKNRTFSGKYVYSQQAFYFILSYCKQKQTTKPQAQGANPDAAGKGKKRNQKTQRKKRKQKERTDHSESKQIHEANAGETGWITIPEKE